MTTRRKGDLRISLLGGFGLWDGDERVAVTRGSERLLAFLALQRGLVRRSTAAGVLWPESREGRANASLRSAIARARVAGRGAIEAAPMGLSLAEGVTVDLHTARDLAHPALRGGADGMDGRAARSAVDLLSSELLPGWYEDWTLLEVENWRQLRLHALEALSRSLAASGLFAEAAGAALAAIGADPLRESSHAALIRVHLSEGNRAEALRAFAYCRELLSAELNLDPTAELTELVVGLSPAVGSHRRHTTRKRLAP